MKPLLRTVNCASVPGVLGVAVQLGLCFSGLAWEVTSAEMRPVKMG